MIKTEVCIHGAKVGQPCYYLYGAGRITYLRSENMLIIQCKGQEEVQIDITKDMNKQRQDILGYDCEEREIVYRD